MKQSTASRLFVGVVLSVNGTSAAVQTVQVGQGGLTYTPSTVQAAVGDVIQFVMASPDHDVVQGDFSNPCQPSSGGIYSGYPSVGSVFSVTVNDTNPMWLYCSTPQHCQHGMVMVVNPPSSGNTLDAYTSAAGSAGSSSAPSDVSGGIVESAAEASAMAASTSNSAASTSSASASSASSASVSAASSASTASESAASSASSASASSASSASVSSASSASASSASYASSASSAASAKSTGGSATAAATSASATGKSAAASTRNISGALAGVASLVGALVWSLI